MKALDNRFEFSVPVPSDGPGPLRGVELRRVEVTVRVASDDPALAGAVMDQMCHELAVSIESARRASRANRDIA